jgi:hypothetical protein
MTTQQAARIRQGSIFKHWMAVVNWQRVGSENPEATLGGPQLIAGVVRRSGAGTARQNYGGCPYRSFAEPL